VKHIANFSNPSDRPKGALDLSNSKSILSELLLEISLNQGIAAYYRGTNALIYKLVLTHAMKFTLYETIFSNLNESNSHFTSSVGAATFTALLTTYPLDLAHGRMAADMSKKVSIVANSKNAPI
jgi:Mitochondrial carrier protein